MIGNLKIIIWKITFAVLGCGMLTSCSSVSKVEKITKADSFLWLEDIDSAKSLEWVNAQNKKTLARYVETKAFQSRKSRILNVLQASDRIPFVFEQNGFLYNFWQDEKNVAGVLRKTKMSSYESQNPKWDVVFDLDKFNSRESKKWVWKGINCLPQSHRCLIRLSPGGGDAVWIKEFDLAARDFVKSGYELPISKSSATWWDENTVLVGTDFGPGSMTDSGYPRILKSWSRGQMLEEAKVLIEGQKQDVFVSGEVFRHDEEKFILLVRNTSFFQSQKYVIGEDGLPSELQMPLDSEVVGLFKGQLIIKLKTDLVRNGVKYVSGSLVSVSRSELDAPFSIVFEPNAQQVVEDVYFSKDRLILNVLENVQSLLVAVVWDKKWSARAIQSTKGASLNVVTSDEATDLVYVTGEGYLLPTTLYKLSGLELRLIRRLGQKFVSDGYTVEQRTAKSKDGTSIPYSVVRPERQKGPLPALMYGYGGFEISLKPHYNPVVGKAWLEEGYVFVVANIRGGGEFGPAWHKSVQKQNRHKAFEDFEAIAEDLIKTGVTSAQQLGIRGGSNGGLLVGATMLRRPELYGAVICEVPLLDMIRYHRLLAGASWVEEYGNPESSADHDYLLSLSPYHQLDEQSGGKKYPEAFLYTSTKDDRVHPGHARKFVAKLQEKGKPVLYYENLEGGHARAADLQQLAHVHALQYSYLIEKLTK